MDAAFHRISKINCWGPSSQQRLIHHIPRSPRWPSKLAFRIRKFVVRSADVSHDRYGGPCRTRRPCRLAKNQRRAKRMGMRQKHRRQKVQCWGETRQRGKLNGLGGLGFPVVPIDGWSALAGAGGAFPGRRGADGARPMGRPRRSRSIDVRDRSRPLAGRTQGLLGADLVYFNRRILAVFSRSFPPPIIRCPLAAGSESYFGV